MDIANGFNNFFLDIGQNLAKNIEPPSENVKNLLDKDSLVMLYDSLFVPYLSYCSEIWGNTYKTNINQLCIRTTKESTENCVQCGLSISLQCII